MRRKTNHNDTDCSERDNVFIKLNESPCIESTDYTYEIPRTIFCERKEIANLSLDKLIDDAENWGTLYAVICIYWMERMLSPSCHTHEKRSHTSIAVRYEVKAERIDILLEQLFERIVLDESEQGDRKRVTVMNLSAQGKALGEELLTKHTSATLEHFYWKQEMPEEASAERFTWYEYKSDSGQNYSKEFEETLNKDWFMQYLIHTSGIALEATSLSQEELHKDCFVQYLVSHVKEVYLSVDPKMWSNKETSLGVNNRKQLFWNR